MRHPSLRSRRDSRSRAHLRRLITCRRVSPSRPAIHSSSRGSSSHSSRRPASGISRACASSATVAVSVSGNRAIMPRPSASRRFSRSAARCRAGSSRISLQRRARKWRCRRASSADAAGSAISRGRGASSSGRETEGDGSSETPRMAASASTRSSNRAGPGRAASSVETRSGRGGGASRRLISAARGGRLGGPGRASIRGEATEPLAPVALPERQPRVTGQHVAGTAAQPRALGSALAQERMAGVVGDHRDVARKGADRRLPDAAGAQGGKVRGQAQQHAGVDVLEIALRALAQVAADHVPGQRRRLALEQLAQPLARTLLVAGLEIREEDAVGVGFGWALRRPEVGSDGHRIGDRTNARG